MKNTTDTSKWTTNAVRMLGSWNPSAVAREADWLNVDLTSAPRNELRRVFESLEDNVAHDAE